MQGRQQEGLEKEQEQDKEQEVEDVTREQLTHLTGLLAKEVSPSCVEARVAGLVVTIQQYREQQVLQERRALLLLLFLLPLPPSSCRSKRGTPPAFFPFWRALRGGWTS